MIEQEAAAPEGTVLDTGAKAPEAGPVSDFDTDFKAAFADLPPEIQGDEDAPGLKSEDDVEHDDPDRELADASDEGGAPGEKTATEVAATGDDAYEKALLALRYTHGDGASLIIKNASREELIALGTQAADRRAKTEAALEERAQRIRELEAGTKAPAEPAKKAGAVDWTPHLKALADKLGYDPDVVKEAFVPVLDAVAQSVRAEFDGRLSKTEQTAQEAAAADGRRQIGEQVRRLSDAHPKLKSDQDLVSKLNTKALHLWKSGMDEAGNQAAYASVADCYDDAAKLVLGAPTGHLAAKRRNGSAPPPEGRVEDRTENSDDAFMKAMERVEAGDTRGARRFGSKVFLGPADRRT